MENSNLTQRLASRAGCICAAMMLLGGAMGLSSCSDDLLTGTPEWLGSSIYDELESRGNFTQTLTLINDPVFRDNPEDTQTSFRKLLGRTGSMTMFVADDAAWQRYLSRRGLASVSQLPEAEKKNLLKGAMVNNAYLIELLSNTSGNPPSEGSCLRRETRLDVFDSIPYVTREQMPDINPYRVDNLGRQIDYWGKVRSRDGIYLFKDNNAAPMMHFLPDYMKNNAFTADDVRTLTNGAADATTASYINGQMVVEKDITCQNGYIHVLHDVPEPLINMADLISKKPQFSIFSALLDRLSCPEYLVTQTINGVEDSLFVKRYFYSTSKEDQFITIPETNLSVSTLLAFDPGYNLYTANGMKMEEDGAAIFVPTDEAMEAYLHAEGAELGQKYGYDWTHIPDNVMLPFLKNCFQTSMRSTVPSKFSTTKNTASEVLGVELEDIDSAFIACNGVVYQTNKVFIAPEYQSVFYPAVLRGDEDLRTIYNAIADERYKGNASAWTMNEFTAYLNSMASSYSFLIPDDQAFALTYFDPYSFSSSYTGDPIAIKFYIKSGSDNPVDVDFFRAELDSVTGELRATDQPTNYKGVTANISFINNRMHDIVDNLIIPHGLRGTQTFREGQSVYFTKGYSPVKVQWTGGKVSGIAGSYQMERDTYISVDPEQIFDKTEAGNGVSYVLGAIPTTTLTSPYKVISDTIAHPDYLEFARLFGGCSFLATTVTGKRTTMDQAIDFMGNYHYTIYVPDNASIKALIDNGTIPTWDTDEAWERFKLRMDTIETEADNTLTADQVDEIIDSIAAWRKTISTVINNFVRYHIQDGAVYIGGADSTGVYETSTMDESINRYRRLTVDNNAGRITVTDALGNVANVSSDEAQSNIVTRQYIFDTGTKAGQIYTSSYVVVHQINKALLFDGIAMPEDFPEPNLESVLSYLKTHSHQSKSRR